MPQDRRHHVPVRAYPVWHSIVQYDDVHEERFHVFIRILYGDHPRGMVNVT